MAARTSSPPPGITREYRERAAARIDARTSTVEEEAKAAKVSPRAVRAWRARARKRAKDSPAPAPRPAPPRDDARLRAALDAAGEPAKVPVAAPRIAPPAAAPGAAPPPLDAPQLEDLEDAAAHLSTQCATPEGVVATVEDLLGSGVMLYASTAGVPDTPALHELAKFTEAERLKLLCWAPYAVPYVQSAVARVPQVGVALFGLALFTLAVGRVRKVRELAPKRLRRAAADVDGSAPNGRGNSASPNSAPPTSEPRADDVEDDSGPGQEDDGVQLHEFVVEGWPERPMAQAGTQADGRAAR